MQRQTEKEGRLKALAKVVSLLSFCQNHCIFSLKDLCEDILSPVR